MEFDFESFLNKETIQRSALAMWLMIIAILLGLAGIVFLVIKSPPPAKFETVELMTPIVTPMLKPTISNGRRVGSVRIKTLVSSNIDWNCLIGTQYFIDMPDGSTWKVPGTRVTRTLGDLHRAEYFTIVPWGAPEGKAQFYVVDSYGCTIRNQLVSTPKVQFHIMPSTPIPNMNANNKI